MICFGVIGSGAWGTKVIHAIRGLGFDVKVWNRHGEFEGNSIPQNPVDVIKASDIVWVATHPPTTCALATDALLRGKPTVVEKPVAFTSQEARELVRLSKERQVPLIVDYIHLFDPRIVVLSNAKTLNMMVGGDGPNRDYSDLWDYGSHALAITIEHIKSPLISASICRSVAANDDYESGNYRICLNFQNGEEVTIITGNRFRGPTAKVSSIPYEYAGRHWSYKLQTLISTIARLHLRGEYWTNGDLAVEVTDLMERLHKMLPAQ